MKKWEYKCLRSRCDDPSFEAGFNALGENGWELVVTVVIPSNFDTNHIALFIFKREKQEKEEKYFEPLPIDH